MSNMKLFIVFVALFVMVCCKCDTFSTASTTVLGTPAPVLRWQKEFEIMDLIHAKHAVERMSKLEDILLKVNQQIAQLETGAKEQLPIEKRDQIVAEMAEANQLAFLVRIILTSDYINRELKRPNLDLTVRAKLETVRAQFEILDQELSEVSAHVQVAIKAT